MTTEQQQPEVKRERGRGRLYHQQGSAIWWMAFYKHGKQIRMSTGEVDEKKAERALKLKLRERDAELGGGRKMVLPKQERFRVSELLDNLETDYRLREIDSPQFKSHLAHIRNHFGDARAIDITAALGGPLDRNPFGHWCGSCHNQPQYAGIWAGVQAGSRAWTA